MNFICNCQKDTLCRRIYLPSSKRNGLSEIKALNVQKINVVLLHDNYYVLKGLETLLDKFIRNIEIRSYESLKSLTKDNSNLSLIDLVILDIDIPDQKVHSFTATLKSQVISPPILGISSKNNHQTVKQYLTANIEGLILKEDHNLLGEAVRNLLNGKLFFSPNVITLKEKYSNTMLKISSREQEVIKMVCDGYDNLLIAEELSISTETVKSHKKNIKKKLGLKENWELVKFAKDLQLI